MREGALLEAIIGVKCPLAPAGGGLSIQPVGWEHHEDEVGVELLLLFSDAADVVVWFHTCGGDILVSLAETPAAPRLRFNQRGDGVAMSYPGGASFLFRGRPRPCSLVCRARVCSTDLPLIAKAVDVLLLVDAVCSAPLSFRSKRLHTMAAHSLRPRVETKGPGAPLLSEIADQFYYNVSLPLIKEINYHYIAAESSGLDYKPF